MKMIRLDDVQIFVHTVDYGSFSEAARQLNIAPAHASASVQRLEKALDTRLFTRSTRSMQLSDAGERYLPHARVMIGALEQGEQALANSRGALTGPLRLSAPSDFGRNLLLPWLDDFQRLHPGLSLHLKMSDRAADLIRQPLDAVVRYGALADSSLLAMRLVDNNRRALCAAPSYLERHGAPAKVEDLRRHNCLRYVWSEQIHERWCFTPPGGERTVAVTGNRISDDADVVRRWAIAGEGLVYKSRLDLIDDLKAGRLVELFPPEYCEPAPLHLICAHRAQLSPAINALHAYLRERCAALLASYPLRGHSGRTRDLNGRLQGATNV
ncbi:DNA-binding transcriptional LysR family regulator [Paraburkholderia sp. JPY158]|uniref:DNA-binding transcriptional LysR family regulator n=2 Tax=Paraburkholderia atlantica TaxID=2654982 RepID=A0A7W8V8R1_PARAM|nr:LysR family transcriptional regulator [Paraburkholderia atlantica]MBB5427242.1 DNA-binding transcriptional LysR family regulator [Paraburkholderia atlantica]